MSAARAFMIGVAGGIGRYLDSVRHSHEQFIEPSKRHADVIFPQGGLNAPAIDVLLAHVRELAVIG